jgi:RNA polymerase sigma-70 factor (ECF subfamily)
MSENREPPDDSVLDELRSRFLSSLGTLRPKLHRFCARMCGSVLDGEDLVQETLAAASFRLSLANPGFLDPSLFEMAYERCRYFIRLDLGHRERTVSRADGLTRGIGPKPPWSETPIEEALAARVSALRPYDRAIVVVKDVLGFSFRETAELIGTTVGHVKVALHRSRAMLRELPPLAPSAPIGRERLAMLQAYADSFNRLDAAGFHRLVRGDARVEFVGAFSGRMRDLESVYAGAYAAIPWDWTQTVALVDGDPALITSRRIGDRWHPYSVIRLWSERGEVVRIRDYMHIRHILRDARIEPVTEPPETGLAVEHG